MVAKIKVHEIDNLNVNPTGEPWIIEILHYLDPISRSFLVTKTFYLNIVIECSTATLTQDTTLLQYYYIINSHNLGGG